MNHGCWAQLDLRKRSHGYGPYDDELVVIRRIEKKRYEERYFIGIFVTEEGKSWFRTINGFVFDVSKLKRKYAIWWTPLPETKPAEEMLREI